MRKALEANRRHWDEIVDIHLRSDFYDVAGFLAGRCTLHPVERREVGDVAGKSLLHLQCHIGLDSLSWARRGAIVTGVDFSAQSVAAARRLSADAGVPARFVQCDLFAAPALIAASFDVVYTSWGVLCWIPDIFRWAQLAAHFLNPGGVLYVAEGHPLLRMFDDDRDAAPLQVAHTYFPASQPDAFEVTADYADPTAPLTHTETFVWHHGLGAVASAVSAAGLRIDFLHEHDFVTWRAFPYLETEDGESWRMPKGMPAIPLSFSLRATR